jgi:hypothetical protein
MQRSMYTHLLPFKEFSFAWLSDGCKWVFPDVKTKGYECLPLLKRHYQNQRQDCNIKVAFKCFKNVAQLKHLRKL